MRTLSIGRGASALSGTLLGALMLGLAACATGSVGISTGLRTYVVRTPAPGDDNLCPVSLAVEPVVGDLAGDQSAAGDKSWLVAKDGTRLYVVWPQGFSLAFGPGPILRDEVSRVVAESGAMITLPQVNRFDHAGTVGDPYFAVGSLFGSCYQRSMP